VDGNGVRVVPDYGCHKSTIKVDERGRTSSHSVRTRRVQIVFTFPSHHSLRPFRIYGI